MRQKIQNLLKDDIIPVVTGYIASNNNGETVLLGRGGSDYSATAIANIIDASRVYICKDEVPCVLTTDPRIVGEDNVYEVYTLSFQEMFELSASGAKVLFKKALEPAAAKNIPVHIRSSIDPNSKQTIVSEKTNSGAKGISLQKHITFHISDANLQGGIGVIEHESQVFREFGVPIEVVSTSESTVTYSVQSSTDPRLIDQILKRFNSNGESCRKSIVYKISIVGTKLSEIPNLFGSVFTHLASEKVKIEGISKNQEDINLTLLLDHETYKHRINEIVKGLHNAVFPKVA